jgi:hypothetical protein
LLRRFAPRKDGAPRSAREWQWRIWLISLRHDAETRLAGVSEGP